MHLSEAGVVARWPSLEAVLQGLTTHLFTGIRGRGTTTCYLWTGLWTFWPGNSPHSRVLAAGSDAAQYAGRDGLFARSCDIDTGRLLPADDLTEVDHRFEHAVHEIGAEERRLAILLTDGPAQPSATSSYVYYEPCADLVTALSTVENLASVCATNTLWGDWGNSFEALTANTTALLKQGRVTEALLHSIDGTCELFRRMRERTAPRT